MTAMMPVRGDDDGGAAGRAHLRLLSAHAASIFATSGMNSPHSRIASPWQACCCCGVPCAPTTPPGRASASATAAAASVSEEMGLSRSFVIGALCWDEAYGRRRNAVRCCSPLSVPLFGGVARLPGPVLS
jgi:hypothetical protein